MLFSKNLCVLPIDIQLFALCTSTTQELASCQSLSASSFVSPSPPQSSNLGFSIVFWHRLNDLRFAFWFWKFLVLKFLWLLEHMDILWIFWLIVLLWFWGAVFHINVCSISFEIYKKFDLFITVTVVHGTLAFFLKKRKGRKLE